MKKDRKVTNLTAAELMSNLNRDADFSRRREERARQSKALEEQFAQAERPVVEALNNAGVPVKSVWDLVNAAKGYPQAIPVLVAHLKRPYPFRIREGIARALTVKDVGEEVYTALVSEFKEVPDCADAAQHGFKWALGNAISVVADKSRFNDVAELVRDKRHGTTRDMMALRLSDLDRERAVDVLLELLADDEVAGHALMGLGKLEVQKARPEIERFLNHPKPWIRKEAKKALAKLNK